MKHRLLFSSLVCSGLSIGFVQNVTAAENSTQNQDTFRLRDAVSTLVLESDKAKGASLSFSNNHLMSDGSAWNSKGALGCLVDISNADASAKTLMIPAVSWNVSKAASSEGKDVEELKLNYLISRKLATGGSSSGFWRIGINPYYLTDFSFEDQIYGAEASAEFVGKPFGGSIYVGDFMNVRAAKPEEKVVQYQLRFVPRINYSVTGKGGVHTARVEGDDWFCAGGLTSLGLRFSRDIPVELGVSYEYMEVLSGKATNVHLFSPSGKWLFDNRNVALTLTYSKGKTIDTAQKVDLLTLALELKH
jgi:hypothetical protein